MTQCLGGSDAPVVAATDYMKALPDGIREWIPARFEVLGTDGFGRSDYRGTCAASSRSTASTSPSPRSRALAAEGAIEASVVSEAIEKYDIDPDAPDPAIT